MLDQAMKRHRFAPDALIEVLHVAQELFGYLDPDILYYIAHAPEAAARAASTASQLSTISSPSAPAGKHTCVVCTGTACYVKGAGRLLAAVEGRVGDHRPARRRRAERSPC